MRKFRNKHALKRRYERKKTLNHLASLSNIMQAGLIPSLVIAISLLATTVIRLNPTEKQLPLLQIFHPTFVLPNIVAAVNGLLAKIKLTPSSLRLPEIHFSFTLPKIPQFALTMPAHFIDQIFSRVSDFTFLLTNALDVFLHTIDPIPLLQFVITDLIQLTGSAGAVSFELLQNIFATVLRAIALLSPIPSTIFMINSLIWVIGKAREIGNELFSILAQVCLLTMQLIINSSFSISSTIEGTVIFLFQHIMLIVLMSTRVVWQFTTSTVVATSGFIGSLFTSLTKVLVDIVQTLSAVLLVLFNAFITIIILIMHFFTSCISLLVRFVEIPFVVIDNYFKQMLPYLEILFAHIHFSSTQIMVSFLQTLFLFSQMLKSFPVK